MLNGATAAPAALWHAAALAPTVGLTQYARWVPRMGWQGA